jgi:predicted DNA-binding transcriptional regulator AlpA
MIPNFDPLTVPPAEIPAALASLAAEQGRLAAQQSALAARLMGVPAATPTPAADRMLTVEEVAERLRCSTKSIYRRAKDFPFARRNGARAWIFSEQGLTKWLARQRV